MPRPTPERLDPANYPARIVIPSRFGDLDPMGHINNIATARIFEEARFRFNRDHKVRLPVEGASQVVVSATIDFLRETMHPADFEIHTGVGQIGRTSWTLHQLAVEGGLAKAIATVTLACTGENGSREIPAIWREGLARWRTAAAMA